MSLVHVAVVKSIRGVAGKNKTAPNAPIDGNNGARPHQTQSGKVC